MTNAIRHGTTTAYAHHKCRCVECRAAVAEYNRKRTAAIRAGTWVPGTRAKAPEPCCGPDCDRVARYVTPMNLCQSHKLQWQRGEPLSPIPHRFRVKDGMKRCSRCGAVKPLDEFNSQTAKYVQSACRPCQSIVNRCRLYGMSFEEMREFMQQPCAGCGSTESLHVDHCHDTNRVRGVLCHNCNTVLTKHMTPTILRRLAEYLEL